MWRTGEGINRVLKQPHAGRLSCLAFMLVILFKTLEDVENKTGHLQGSKATLF
jgi:hypothetical protein